MGKYNWKDKYYRHDNADLESSSTCVFISPLGTNKAQGANGSREKPYMLQGYSTSASNYWMVLSAGYHRGTCSISGQWAVINLLGQGIRNTMFSANITNVGQAAGVSVVKDMIIDNAAFKASNSTFSNCDIRNMTFTQSGTTTVRNCIIRINSFAGINNTYMGVDGITLPNANLNTFINSDVLITSSDISGYRYNYLAFDNCRLKIGNEAAYLALNGTTEEELRADFVERCAAQNITVQDVTDFGETLKQGRWVFSSDSCVDADIVRDSVIHNFEKRRFIYFGYSDARSESIGIGVPANAIGGFSSANPNGKVSIEEQSISFSSDVDIAQKNTAYADTNIIVLNGLKQLSAINIAENFPKQYGVFVDSSPSLSSNPVNEIVPYENGEGRTYLVRSTNDLEATVTYNGNNYNSSLVSANNIFRGVAGKTTFTASENAEVYEIVDEVMHQTIQMRIVDNIPADIITPANNLLPDYWYLVEHDTDQTNDTDYVTYKGVNYPVGGSFLADNTASFTKRGNVHLRRCWKDAFDYDAETTDKAFWQNRQKPKWFDVLPEDPRCLRQNNNQSAAEMQTDDNGTYIASGHPDFYNSILGVNSVRRPSYPVKGAYMQLRLMITTLNPM